MDLAKIGKFIAERRKAIKLTQVQLAEKIMVSEKTISKWECGNGFPDTTLMLPLCEVLEISANELLCGKKLSNEEYKNSAEKNIVALKSSNEKLSKMLLCVEWIVGIFSIIILLGCCIVASYVEMADIWRALLIVAGFVLTMLGVGFGIWIEKDAGFYECGNCHHKYIPTFSAVLWSPHFGRTRRMKCPKCGKRTWNKKVINGE